MSRSLEFSVYNVSNPDWFVRSLNSHLEKRALAELSGGMFTDLRAGRHHPFVALVGASLSGDHSDNARGRLPAIGISATTTKEELTTVGQGTRHPYDFPQSEVDNLKAAIMDPSAFLEEVLLARSELDLLQEFVTKGGGIAYSNRSTLMFRTETMISAWAATIESQILLEKLIAEYLVQSRRAMTAAGIKDITVSWDSGLTNMDFGMTIFGVEFSIAYLNKFTSYTVFEDRPLNASAMDIEVIGNYLARGYANEPPVQIPTE